MEIRRRLRGMLRLGWGSWPARHRQMVNTRLKSIVLWEHLVWSTSPTCKSSTLRGRGCPGRHTAHVHAPDKVFPNHGFIRCWLPRRMPSCDWLAAPLVPRRQRERNRRSRVGHLDQTLDISGGSTIFIYLLLTWDWLCPDGRAHHKAPPTLVPGRVWTFNVARHANRQRGWCVICHGTATST